ncbi:MAG: hypothetical protein K2H29_03940 [Oscillospiraceae bacterium]|nr:hypothetical protein [Oscillospiraceae bacterium]
MDYFSIMGDSISTFVGSQPKNYNVYYDYENLKKNAMRSLSDVWWSKVISYFRGTLCLNNSFAGSFVAGKRFPSGNCVQRTELLHNGEYAPEYILIYMGIKDFGRGVPIRGRNFFRKNPIYFEDAYTLMLRRIKLNYPSSVIICGTVARTYHARIPNWQFPEKFQGIALEEYNETIRLVAEKQKCPVADLSAKKIYYETLDGTHPTLIGHEELAQGWMACLHDIL